MSDRLCASARSVPTTTVIPDGAWPPVHTPDPAVVAELRGESKFVVMHAGNLGGAGAWQVLKEAARKLEGQAHVVFVGDGIEAESLRRDGMRVVPFRRVEE